MNARIIKVLNEVMRHMANDEDTETYNHNVYDRVAKLHDELVAADKLLVTLKPRAIKKRAKAAAKRAAKTYSALGEGRHITGY